MNKHTPAPWQCCGDSISGGMYVPANPKADSHPYEIATIAYSERNYPWIPQGEVRDANAKLIAAAPDLLAACKAVAAALERIQQDGSIVWLHGDDCAVHESASERLAWVISLAEKGGAS